MKIFLLIILILAGYILAAQTYHPFPTKNALWTEMYFNPYPREYSEFHCFALKDKDTIIKGRLYHKLYQSTDTLFTEHKLCGGIREENKKVYFYPIDPSLYWFDGLAKELILYDFSLKLGDTIRAIDSFRIGDQDLKVVNVDSTLTVNGYRKTIRFGMPDGTPIPFAVWLEGVGSLRGLLFMTGDVPNNGYFNDLICFRQDNVFLYHYDNNNVNQYHYDRYNSCYYIKPDAVEIVATNTKLIIAPNPVKTTARIEFEKTANSRLILSDLYGRTLMEYNMEGKTSIEISRSGLSNGLYLIAIYDKHGNKHISKVIFEY